MHPPATVKTKDTLVPKNLKIQKTYPCLIVNEVLA